MCSVGKLQHGVVNFQLYIYIAEGRVGKLMTSRSGGSLPLLLGGLLGSMISALDRIVAVCFFKFRRIARPRASHIEKGGPCTVVEP